MRDLHCPLIINQRRYSIFDRSIEDDGVKKRCFLAGRAIHSCDGSFQHDLRDCVFGYRRGRPGDGENISGAEGCGIWKNRINGLFLKAVLGGCHARGLSKGDAEAVLTLVTAGKSDVLDRACGGSEIIPGALQTDGGKILVWSHTGIFFKLANEVGGIQRQVVRNLLHSERALEILLYIVERALYGITGIR